MEVSAMLFEIHYLNLISDEVIMISEPARPNQIKGPGFDCHRHSVQIFHVARLSK